jgi:hypothetical protein
MLPAHRGPAGATYAATSSSTRREPAAAGEQNSIRWTEAASASRSVSDRSTDDVQIGGFSWRRSRSGDGSHRVGVDGRHRQLAVYHERLPRQRHERVRLPLAPRDPGRRSLAGPRHLFARFPVGQRRGLEQRHVEAALRMPR